MLLYSSLALFARVSSSALGFVPLGGASLEVFLWPYYFEPPSNSVDSTFVTFVPFRLRCHPGYERLITQGSDDLVGSYCFLCVYILSSLQFSFLACSFYSSGCAEAKYFLVFRELRL